MFQALRTRIHLSPATVIATIALVFAMSGGAYAAGKYLITSTKQISPKVLKTLQGKAGARGATGPQGLAGTAGAGSPGSQGPTGPAGPGGPKGETGAPGAPGINGKNGTNGKEGSPWTAGGTLPSGKTETGVWWLPNGAGSKQEYTQISFPIPLAEPLTWGEGKAGEPEDQVHYINPSGKEVTTTNVEVASHPACSGTVAKPEATPDNLCIYASSAPTEGESASNETIINPRGSSPGASVAGALLLAEGRGTWAVTAK
jgi:hypothetical protein